LQKKRIDYGLPWWRPGEPRLARVLWVVVIMITLAAGTKMGVDPITMLGWTTLAGLLLGRQFGLASDISLGGKPDSEPDDGPCGFVPGPVLTG
jgi:hypothetical protein